MVSTHAMQISKQGTQESFHLHSDCQFYSMTYWAVLQRISTLTLTGHPRTQSQVQPYRHRSRMSISVWLIRQCVVRHPWSVCGACFWVQIVCHPGLFGWFSFWSTVSVSGLRLFIFVNMLWVFLNFDFFCVFPGRILVSSCLTLIFWFHTYSHQ